MGPKKKGKGSKLARMSEEEKIRYLQHRAAIEEEARRRKEQLISTFMKNKLKHEEAFTRLNSAKINQQWRHLLRKLKCKELKDDMEALWKSFETTMNCKTRLIDTLLSDLENADWQYAMMFHSHSETVDKLIELHRDRLDSLHRFYNKERIKMMAKAKYEHEKITAKGNRDGEHLQAVIFEMNKRFSNEKHKTDSSCENKQDELRNQMLSDIEKVEEACAAKLEHLWQALQKVLKDYTSAIEPMRVHYGALCDRDSDSSTQLMVHCDTINKYTELIINLKQQLATKQKSYDQTMCVLKKEQSTLFQKFHHMRTDVTNHNKSAESKLTHLSIVSSNVIKELTRKLEKAKSVIQLSEKCKKFQKDEEKSLLSYCRHLMINKETTADQKEKIPEPFDKLGNFWHLYNESVVDCYTLKLRKESLLADNRQLKRLLRHYLNTLAQPHSVPNKRSQLTFIPA
ncbi:dynein regulatory complex subunit 2 [Nilaparvata lugens]|uniref:dynein regulatory complex subunit 2 n=1 Tax=Nilaparvata lugens TaxID=108931 RepID=UPI00193EA9BA|nr:dynein regulatory complex subunit 2 [Nilaparvata lugens]XP_039293215.1 dynein regulatory complex subunit 2 [Nilaparvata lugens]